MKTTKTLELIFKDYNKSKHIKSGRLSKAERKSVKMARSLRADKNKIWAD